MGVVDMEEREVFALGLGLSEPWELSGQRLDIEKRPHERGGSVCLNRFRAYLMWVSALVTLRPGLVTAY